MESLLAYRASFKDFLVGGGAFNKGDHMPRGDYLSVAPPWVGAERTENFQIQGHPRSQEMALSEVFRASQSMRKCEILCSGH